MEVTNEVTNELKFIMTNPEGITTPEKRIIIDYQSQNMTNDCRFLYFLMGIDKLHDFGDFFTKIYDFIYKYCLIEVLPFPIPPVTVFLSLLYSLTR